MFDKCYKTCNDTHTSIDCETNLIIFSKQKRKLYNILFASKVNALIANVSQFHILSYDLFH